MYGTNVPTNIAAGLPGAVPAVAAGWGATESLWLTLLVITLLALGTTLLRLIPKPQR